jgi:hypothetical protein
VDHLGERGSIEIVTVAAGSECVFDQLVQLAQGVEAVPSTTVPRGSVGDGWELLQDVGLRNAWVISPTHHPVSSKCTTSAAARLMRTHSRTITTPTSAQRLRCRLG